MRGSLLGLGFFWGALCLASAEPVRPCEALLKAAMAKGPDHLLPLSDDEVAGLSPIVRHSPSLVWSMPGPVYPEVLVPKLSALMDHIVNLTLSNTPSHVGLLLDYPIHVQHLAIQKAHIDQLVAAWTSERGYVDLGDGRLLGRQLVQELAAKSYLEEREISHAIAIESGLRGFRSRYPVPPMKLAGLPLRWSVRMDPSPSGGVNVVVTPHQSFNRLSDAPVEIEGQRQLRIYGQLTRLFGEVPHSVPGFHRHVFIRSQDSQGPRKRQVDMQRVMDALEQVAGETHGRIDQQEFFNAVALQLNLQVFHAFCYQSKLCAHLNSSFLDDYIALYGDNAVTDWQHNENGTFDFPDDTGVVDHMFEDFCHSVSTKAESGHHLLGWDHFLEFSQRYFAGYDSREWRAMIQKFRLESLSYQASGFPLTVGMRVPFQNTDHLLSSRVQLGPARLKLGFDIGRFEDRARVEDLDVRSLVLGFKPTKQAFFWGDLSENHLKAMIHRIDHLLDNP